METPLWERSKENAAPLQRGRNVHTLEASMAMDTDQQVEKGRMVQHYEKLVGPSEASDFTLAEGDDPLIHWLSYIKFHQDTFSSDKHAQFLLFERCLRSLSSIARYRNDVRFIRVCCMYAEQTDQPSTIFQHLHSQKIGVETALFWMAWGFVAEHMCDYKLAEKIYSKGIRKKAHPVEKLIQRHRQFQRRMTRYWLNSNAADDEANEECTGNEDQHRGALGFLSEDTVRQNHRSRSSNQAARPFSIPQQSFQPNASNTQTGTFSIFADGNPREGGLDDSFAPVGSSRTIERQEDRRKENTQQPGTWTGRGGYTSSYVPAPQPMARPSSAFSVYVDEECSSQQAREQADRNKTASRHRQARDDRTFRERKEGVADRLGQDPLRYVRDPSQYAADQQVSQPVSRQRRPNKMGFDKYLLKNSQGDEQCFEEARLIGRFFSLSNMENVNMLEVTADSSMSIDESMVDSTAGKPPPGDKYDRGKKMNVSFNSELITPRNASTASSTVDDNHAVGAPTDPTINTQLALKELSMMFSSPAMGIKEPARSNGIEENGDTADIGALAEVIDSNMDSENCGPTNPNARSPIGSELDRMALQTLREVQDSTSTSCATERRTIGVIDQSDPLRSLPERELEDDPGFAIYEDDQPPVGSFAIYDENAAPSTTIEVESSSSFAIHNDNVALADGDTATFSLFGDAMAVLQDDDDPSSDTSKKRKRPGSTESVPSPLASEDASGNLQATDDTTILLASQQASDYEVVHAQDIQNAAKALAKRGIGRLRGNSKSLVQILGQKQKIYYLPALGVPKGLRGKKSSTGAGICVGESAGVVEHELGRGAYGIVALLKATSEDKRIAVKAQAPADCLAWEYRILELLMERVKDRCLPFFPRPLSFLSLKDGALFSMTAGSKSGLNLIDLLNIYNVKLGESIPEVLVFYYSTRMLHHLEMLHWHGKILHCDTKPDNWVLVASASISEETIEASELMLVDFGRAKDLSSPSVSKNQHPLDTQFIGTCCADEMMCVTMRQGLPWSFDVDTFGLCASLHVLLFGCHMKVAQTSKNRWMPKERLRRYHNADLWHDIFDTLLNIEYASKAALGSRPMSVHQLRERIEGHLKRPQEKEKLLAALKHQAAFLPPTRLTA